MSWFRRPDPPPPPLRCSFCGKSQMEVKKLVAAPDVHICDECVRRSADALATGRQLPPPSSVADLAERLDRRVVGRERTTRALATLVQRHLAGPEGPPAALLVGPPGAGKTALLDALADLCGLPAIRVDAGRLSASGYVGDDLETFLGELRIEDPVRAERGLLLVDGVHHLAARERAPLTSLDVRGTRAQDQLIRLLERRPARAVTGRRHPAAYYPLLKTRGLMVVFAATLEAARIPVDLDRAPRPRDARLDPVRRALEAAGLVPALLRRVPVVLWLQRRRPEAMLGVVRDMADELAAQGPLDLDEPGRIALAERAAAHADGAWVIRQGLSAALTRGASPTRG
jgi:ATP-dependent Clp protease ATP-binding subunit ClpX